MTQTEIPGPTSTPRGVPIMAAKFLLPKIRQPVVQRERLFSLLSDGVRGPLTLISAPAGSGKSLLAGSWAGAGRAPGPHTWISLEEDDNSPGVFWTYVLAGLARGEVAVEDIAPPEAEDVVDRSLLVRLAARLCESPTPVVLILDNAEALSRQQICDQLDFVLRHAGGRLRLVLITRVDPRLPLHQYRLEGTLAEIRFHDLAFTVDEAAELLGGRDADVMEGGVLTFADRTRGWAAGLRLGGPEVSPSVPLPLGESVLAAYFRAEVLDAHPRHVREFLVSTCVVDRLTVELATYLSGDRGAAATLRALAQASIFVEACPEEGDSYEYHPLIRDLLRAELRREPGARARRLHRRAAQWLLEAGRVPESIEQYAAADDWRQAARVVVANLPAGSLLTAPPADATLAVLTRMPEDTAGPEAALVAAMLAWRDQDLTACQKHLACAEELLVEVPHGADVTPLRLGIALTAGALACWLADADGALCAAGTAEQLQAAGAQSGIVPAPSTRALTLWLAGYARLHLGDLSASRQVLAAAVRTANVPGDERLRARCLADLALAEALSGELVRAQDTAQRAVDHGEHLGPAAAFGPVTADVALAWIHAERGDYTQARAHAERAAAVLLVAPEAAAVVVLGLVRCRLLRARSDHAGALAALDACRAAEPSVRLPTWLAHRLDIAQAAVLTTQGHVRAAAQLLRDRGAVATREGLLSYGWAELPTDPGTAGRVARQLLDQDDVPREVRVGALLLEAACDLQAARVEAARVGVDKALELAEPEGFRRCLEEVPPRLRSVVRDRYAVRGSRHVPAIPGRAAPGVPQPRHSARVIITQPLTERETEVLGHLAELLPTEEIAGQMFVSVNTVKTHIRAILRKLGVERRNEAVRRARDLGLV